LVAHADLSDLPTKGWNEIAVDGRGNCYINGTGFNLMAGEPYAPGIIALVDTHGMARIVATGIAFPNGMVVTPDGSTFIVAESYGKRLTAFDITREGSLETGGSGPIWGIMFPTASASAAPIPCGMRMSPTSVVCMSAKGVRCCKRSRWIAAVSPVR